MNPRIVAWTVFILAVLLFGTIASTGAGSSSAAAAAQEPLPSPEVPTVDNLAAPVPIYPGLQSDEVDQRVAATISFTRTVPGLELPNGMAVHPDLGRIYVSSRDNDQLLVLDALTLAPIDQETVSDSPWGVAVDIAHAKVYVASFSTGTIRVFATTAGALTPVTQISLGSLAQPTFLTYDTGNDRIYVGRHGDGQVSVIDTVSDTVERTFSSGGSGTWGVAAAPQLHRLYLTHRDTGYLTVFDTTTWQQLYVQTFQPCGTTGTPFGLAFNPGNSRLYISCALNGNVNSSRIYEATPGNLRFLGAPALGSGGANGGGGIAVNPNTNNVFFTNSLSNSVTVVGPGNQVVAVIPTGPDPFPVVADARTNLITVGNRQGGKNTLTVFVDPGAAAAGPSLTIGPQNTCGGAQVTVAGAGWPYDPARSIGHVTVRLDGSLLLAVDVLPNGSFQQTLALPGGSGGIHTVTGVELLLPWVGATTTVRTPRTDIPIIFIPGAAGSEIRVEGTWLYTAAPDGNLQTFIPNTSILFPAPNLYTNGEPVWMGFRGVAEMMIGNWRYYDILRLRADGLTQEPDIFGVSPTLYVGGPLRSAGGVQDVYQGMIDYLDSIGYKEQQRLFFFPWDWRKTIQNLDVGLSQQIDSVLATTHKDKVVLIAHSTGGVIARDYLLKHGTTKVDQVITMGTGFLGLPHPLKYLEKGDDLGMGFHIGNEGIGLHPAELQKMVQNAGCLYDILPGPMWYQDQMWDFDFDPNYVTRQRIQGLSVIKEPLGYSDSIDWIGSRHNPALAEQGKAWQARPIGDMQLLTDQYYAHRIAGMGLDTYGHFAESPRQACANICFFKWCKNVCINLAANVSVRKDMSGDDTVTYRSAIGGNIGPNDDRYYFFNNVHHMNLPANDNVQWLLGRLLSGNVCGTGTLSAMAVAAPGAEATASTRPESIRLAPTVGVTATEVVLLGSAALHIWDGAGNHAGPLLDQPAGSQSLIPDVSYENNIENQVAMIRGGGPYTITIRGRQADGAALLRISPMAAGAVTETMAYVGIPITTTTVATITLPGPGLPPGPLTVDYGEGAPVQAIEGRLLAGAEAEDDIPPVVDVTIDLSTRRATVTALDNVGGVGLETVLYSTDRWASSYRPYTGTITLPSNAQRIWATAGDRAGNWSLPAYAEYQWLPLVAN